MTQTTDTPSLSELVARDFTAEMLARSRPVAVIQLPPFKLSPEAEAELKESERSVLYWWGK